jgi:hypothetical protein
MPEAVTHLTPQEVAAFGLGKLPERAAAGPLNAAAQACPISSPAPPPCV